MKTAWQIEFDFGQARQQAGQLEEIAQRLTALANNRVRSAQEELPSYWTGRSADLFRNKQEELRSNILSTARELQEQAETIRTIARRRRRRRAQHVTKCATHVLEISLKFMLFL